MPEHGAYRSQRLYCHRDSASESEWVIEHVIERLSSLVHAKGAATSPMRRLPFGRLPFAAALSALPACVAMRLAPAGMGFAPQFATRGGALRTALSPPFLANLSLSTFALKYCPQAQCIRGTTG